jgi:hypothetical protein
MSANATKKSDFRYPGDFSFRKFWIFLLAVFVLVVQACATTKPPPLDLLAYKNRAKSSVNEGMTVTVAVPTIAEAQAIYGVDLASQHIQPIRYHGKPVWIGQASLRQGGRFVEKSPVEVTLPLDPHVDEARNNLTQDMAYSQALLKIGFTKGSGQSQSTQAEKSSEGVYYATDGLRVVLVFGDRPVSLEGIDFFNWERLVDYR